MRRLPLLGLLASVFFLLPAVAQARVMEGGTDYVSRRTLLKQEYAKIAERAGVKTPAMVTFISPREGITFKHPESWIVDATQSREDNVTFVLMLTPSDSHEKPVRHNINLVLEELDRSYTLAEYTDAGLAREREFFAEFTLLLRHTRVIAGHEATFVRFDANYGGISLRYEQAWFLRGNEAVVWTFAADAETFDQSSGVFEDLLESLLVNER